MVLLYRLSLTIYSLAIAFASLFNEKARLFKSGRKGLLSQIKSANIAVQRPIWFHCASLGEFEQARSIIDGLHEKGEKILLTFFSPSGYEIRKSYAQADWVFYLPMDSKKNASQFLEWTQPKLAIFVKYDLWHFYLAGLKEKSTPTFLISALFRKGQVFFIPILGRLHRDMLSSFDRIYLQNQESNTLLSEIGMQQTKVVGDTRVDSVLQRKNQEKKLPLLNAFLGEQKAIIFGSAYAAEIEILRGAIPSFQNEKIIIAPHEVDEANIVSIQNQLGLSSIRYSTYQKENKHSNILIIDNIGTLFHSYRYAKLVFIGGGYKGGLHNILEPAAFGIPICFGPKYQNFVEAVEMINRQCAFSIQQSSDLKSLYSRLEETIYRNEISQKINEYMQASKGASHSILEDVLQKIQTG